MDTQSDVKVKDFSTNFDKVDHNLIIQNYFGDIQGLTDKLVRNLLSHCKQKVVYWRLQCFPKYRFVLKSFLTKSNPLFS